MTTSAPLTVSLDVKTSNLLALLAASHGTVVEGYAAEIIEAHCAEALRDEAVMADLGRALLSGRSNPLSGKVERAAPAKSRNEPDGLPAGYSRAKDGTAMCHRTLRKSTFSADDAAQSLGTSIYMIHRAVKENAVVPFALLGSAKYPRFKNEELEQIDRWMRTPCTKGKAKRSIRCVCGRYFSKAGLRMHRTACDGKDDGPKVSIVQR